VPALACARPTRIPPSLPAISLQVLTGESWSEAVVRPLVFGVSPYSNAVVVSVFFVSYILLTQVVLQNVVVAVLLDKFVEDPDAEENNEAAKIAAALQAVSSPLDSIHNAPRDLPPPLNSAVSGAPTLPSSSLSNDESALSDRELLLGVWRAVESLRREQAAMRAEFDEMHQL
jgi:hypothetical protein